ncbi:hypothetical protein ACFQ8O_32075 [Streptomyces coelicoflavus]|uniref:hypothetical protein n=1 Tax=Streptomyces coelicoflavus TaxID=285562 RepID=UPI0036829ED6
MLTVVLTRFHEDHAGGAAEAGALAGAEVVAHALDAPVVPAALNTEGACFGHGDPVTARAGDVLRAAARTYGAHRAAQTTGEPASR